LTLTLAEMYVQGVSTRKVAAILEQLCGSGVSSSAVSLSFDVAFYPKHGTDVATLQEMARAALDEARQGGGNRVVAVR
jgi:GGDEF domain-containing protein